MHLDEHHLKALEASVAADQRRDSISLVSSSKGISQSPEQSPEGQSEAPRAEQLPAQLAPSPQVASWIVLFWWQQLTVTDSFAKVKTLSKKSTVLAFLFPEVYIEFLQLPTTQKLKNLHFGKQAMANWRTLMSMEPSQLGRPCTQQLCCTLLL